MLDHTDVAKKADKYLHLCLSSIYAKEQQVVFVIDQPDLVNKVDGHYSGDKFELLFNSKATVKLEGFESFDESIWLWCKKMVDSYNHSGPFAAHVFIAPKDGLTFTEHVDPDDVLICTVSGSKTMMVSGVAHVVNEGDVLLIPANTPHYAVNDEASIMISVGMEKWMVDKL